MKRLHLALGVACGTAIGLGGVVVNDLATEPAEAQSSTQFATKADLKRVEQNSSAAQRIAKSIQNQFGIYWSPENELISLTNPQGQIRQERGKGEIGLPASRIGTGAIGRAKIAAEAVDSEKIAPGGVTSGDLADASVTNAKVGAGAISTASLASGAVTAPKISDGAVTKSKLAADVLPKVAVDKLDVGSPIFTTETDVLRVDLPGAGSGYAWAISVQANQGVGGGFDATCRVVDENGSAYGPEFTTSTGSTPSTIPRVSTSVKPASQASESAILRCVPNGGPTSVLAGASLSVVAATS